MKEPLSIIQIIPRAGCHSGGTFQAYQLAKALLDKGHNSLLITRPGKQAVERAKDMKIPVETIRMKNEWDFKSIMALRRIITERKVNVVHAHKGLALSLSLFALMGNRRTVLVANRGVMFPLDPFNRLKYRSGKLDAVVAVSSVVKDITVKSSGLKENKVRVIYGGTDLQRFNWQISPLAMRNEFKINNAYPVVGIVANIRSWKGHIYFVEAAAKVLTRFPEAKFFIVGGYKEERDTYKNLMAKIDELGIGKSIFITGFRDDIPELMAGMDITVNASYDGEGLTGTIRESFAMKKPVIATRIAGNPELVEEGVTGILVKPKSPDALSEAMISLLGDRERLALMGENAYRTVLERFSLQSRINNIENLYYELLSCKRKKN